MPAFQSLVGGVLAMPPNDLRPVALVESCVVAAGELISVGRDQPLQRFPHKDELEVVTQAVVDLGRAVFGETAQVGGDVRLAGWDLQWVLVFALPCQDHHDSLPVSASHLGDIAVEQTMDIIDHQVAQIIRGQEAALAGVPVAHAAQQFPPVLVSRLQGGQLKLPRHKTEKESWLRAG